MNFKGLLLLLLPLSINAQSIEGTDYYLPKAAVRFTVKVEKTQYTPGKLAPYASRFLRTDVDLEPTTTYRLLGVDMATYALPDTSRHFTLIVDKKHSINKVCRADNGQLLAINADASATPTPMPSFKPGRKAALLNPQDFMTEDILNAGSNAKMAELAAQEIYDIRDSRNQLNRGEADFMPKDGTQMAIMLNNLGKQEAALTQLFTGVTVKDTTWTNIDFVPTQEGRQMLFRLSKWLGLVDADDLSGEPYMVSVTDKHTVAAPQPTPESKKEDKNDIGLRVCQPSKIQVAVSHGQQVVVNGELLAPQFGTIESLSGELFGKKQSAKLILDPLTGGVKSIQAITNN